MRALDRTLALACLILLIAGTARADDRPWIEVRSPRFTVVSQAGEKSAPQALTIVLQLCVVVWLVGKKIPTMIDNAYRHLNKADNLRSLRRTPA